jgi:hypothetical protein
MFTSVQSSFSASSAYLYQEVLPNISSSEIIKRIREIAVDMFTRVSEFFNAFNKPSNENNLKVFALISCASLIALLVISMLRRRDTRIVYPSTPGIGE